MPLYEYECRKCGHRFEKIEKLDSAQTKKCPECGGKAERLLAAPAIQFKGSGWYVTDYARKSSPKSEGKEKREAKEAEEVKPAKPAVAGAGKQPAKSSAKTD